MGELNVNVEQLKEMVVALNESGLLDEKIAIEGVEDDDLVEAFLTAVEANSQGDEFEGPQEVADFYNEIIDQMDVKKEPEAEEKTEAKETPVEEAESKEKVKPVEKAEKEAEKPKKKSEKVEEGEKAKVVKKSRYDHRVDSQAAILDDLLHEGTTLEDAAKKIDSKAGRVKSHIYHLTKKHSLNVTCDEKTGVYKVAA